MSHPGPRPIAEAVIDSLEFARQGASLGGEVGVARLDRLADMLAEPVGVLKVELRGGRDRDGNPCLELKARGSLRLRCQRCLGVMDWPVAVDSLLRLVAPGGEWPDDELADDDSDAIPAEHEQAVLPLVEEEVLLALPIAPRHEECVPPGGADKNEALSPFAALAQLKRK